MSPLFDEAKLGEICSFSRGLTYKKNQEVEYSSNSILRANNITLDTGELNFEEIKYISDDINIPAAKKVRNGSLLICTASGSKKHLGKVALIDGDLDFAFGGFMGLLTPTQDVFAEYLYWLTRSKRYDKFISGLNDGTNINNLKFSQLREFRVPLPPLPEQRRIIAILDEAFTAIATATANAERNLGNARELFESHLNEVFSKNGEGWFERRMGDECEVIMGQSPAGSSYNTGGIGVPLINGPVEFGGIDPFSNTVASKFTDAPTKMCRKGDLILCVRGSTTGRMNIAGHDSCIGRGVAAIRSETNQSWVNQFISFSRNAIYEMGSGSTFPNVSSSTLKDFAIPFPPADQRSSIVKRIESLSAETQHLESIYQRKLDALAELKQSILQKAFAGELTSEPDKVLAEAGL